MTSSFLLIAADIAGPLKTALSFGSALAVLGFAGGCLVAWGIDDYEDGRGMAKRILLATIPFLIIACLIPTPGVLYAAAANQLRLEQVGTASEIAPALQNWIRKQTEAK